MAFSASLDRSQEIRNDLSSLARLGGPELIKTVYRDFCACKKLEPLFDEVDLEGSIADRICELSDRFRGQFRQSVCKAIEKARQ